MFRSFVALTFLTVKLMAAEPPLLPDHHELRLGLAQSGGGLERAASARGWRLTHAARSKLHADPRSDVARALGYGVFPGALAGTAHDQQVAVTEIESKRCSAQPRPQQ